jgi:biotin operon repressor
MSTYKDYVESDRVTIDGDKEIVLNILRRHRGRENAISARAIAEETTVSESTVRDMVADLREQWSIPVASLGRGYFLIEDGDELDHVVEQYQQTIETKRERMQTIVQAFNGHKYE